MDTIKHFFKRYFIDAMSATAIGLFSTLIIGTLLEQLAKISVLSFLSPIASVATSTLVIGAAIGVAVSHGLGAKPLVILSCAVVGAVGYSDGGAVGAYLSAVIGAELASLVASKTKLDIILTPLVTVLCGGLTAVYIGPYIDKMMSALGGFINSATEYAPIPMGIVISVVVGMALTAPISSVALCVMIGIDGIAAGAAAVGCACQMVGFAVASYRDNGIGGSLSVGIGTSMLMFPSILRHPLIWLSPTLASAILGPVSTALLGMTNTPAGAGMGTLALVGQFSAFEAMSGKYDTAVSIIIITVMHIILPAVLTLLFDFAGRRIGYIKSGYMRLDKLG